MDRIGEGVSRPSFLIGHPHHFRRVAIFLTQHIIILAT
jgi:hypothetical protein